MREKVKVFIFENSQEAGFEGTINSWLSKNRVKIVSRTQSSAFNSSLNLLMTVITIWYEDLASDGQASGTC